MKEQEELFRKVYIQKMEPIAYEYRDPSGHCYVDYVRRPDIEMPDGEYTATPLYYSSQFSVKLPSDEEIKKEALKLWQHSTEIPMKYWEKGAKWVIDYIKGKC